ncbi:nitroreductase family protein [Halobacillus hunanensis]|uniref:nitroreductase family protein n=1 Tax=Halobacillus hunanensis TaxID=578214 RepID=UPI0009A89996|nr:nitroreductase family protein [Halobacillus hunanensis]
MDVLEAIKARREITSYKDEPVPDDILRKVEDAGVFAPTGNNLPSKHLIVVKERGTLDKLAETTPYMSWMKKAQAAIVVVGKPEVSKYWLQDASFACAFIWLEAVEVGLGSAFGAIYHAQDQQESEERETHVRKLLEIPEECRIVAGLGLGYPDQTPKPKTHVPRDEIVRYETF